eukprot:Plantae.Rhodophyta-Hildenbrandia_rubra.ctg13356.p1 GENE.Plantae.Rhodophyta-Hildenbrandia_rubra.ctg13356~~Plantae.Rhodophyta-Hildenbrandia_rubra.ctg13356.p1  ORF type:complete len:511 (+),score=117.18 Plantae.Rhodophyta-Hildenbrandia_rubra.ctg13356:255-1787(+)
MAADDVEMTEKAPVEDKVEGSKDEKDEKAVDAKKKDESPEAKVAGELRVNLVVLERAVASKDLRLIARALRETGNIRRRLTHRVLEAFVKHFVDEDVGNEIYIGVNAMKNDMEVEGKGNGVSDEDTMKQDVEEKLIGSKKSDVVEIMAYIWLLVVMKLIDARENDATTRCSAALVEYLGGFNRRTLDEINARAYFFYSLAAERIGKLSFIRSNLLKAHCAAVLHLDQPSQAMLYNLLLRNYLVYKLYDQAEKFISRAVFPSTRSNNQLARHFYYVGRIKAVQLDYTEALGNLRQSLRKAPQNTALGFRIAVQKMIIIVQLLTGDIPERSVFRGMGMGRALSPYLDITKAVRVGDLNSFNATMEKDQVMFEKDGLVSLIARLRHNVIKTGLRKIAVSYSKISLEAIRSKLGLESKEDTEFVVAKAIRDGVIDAVINSKGGYVSSKESGDIYSTMEPAESYHARIEFCLNIHNEARKAMRFPNEKTTEERKRERPEEIANRIVEEEEEDAKL